ncbi:hypothetical protein [Allobranchiibius huperziae]|uniref:Uncharacterized protein n=1 Tax=Allobranchiibius huperziae TaxID=1874116 RepID=A0A853DEU3_9MICO|nr:hypothetical protein [Allobranchiibius huperziae]NYJ76076.1 hypothetical protein [Allobranchiibius huperziae]
MPKREGMPQWLQTQLIADGTMTAARITHRHQQRACPSCHSARTTPIPAWEAAAVWLDPTPLDSGGELAALMDGATTFHFYPDEVIERRFAHDITDAPALSGIVLRPNICGKRQLSQPTKTISTTVDPLSEQEQHMTTILGIDPSLTRTAVAVIQPETWPCVTSRRKEPRPTPSPTGQTSPAHCRTHL